MSFLWFTEDGEKRCANTWRAEGAIGVVACVHGMGGAGEQFAPLPEMVKGFSFYALDLRGQGRDPVVSRRGLALNVEWQMRDIAAFLKAVRQAHPDEPLYLMGESMGSLLVASYAAGGDRGAELGLSGVILSAPVVALIRAVPKPVRLILRTLGKMFPNYRLSPNRFVNGNTTAPPITRDRAYQDSLKEKTHYISNFSLGFLVELGALIDGSKAIAKKIKLPTLVLAAGQDCYVRIDQVESWFHQITSENKTLRVYPDAYHLLWHDWDKNLVGEDISKWLSQER
jgi:acylglycerol lipase